MRKLLILLYLLCMANFCSFAQQNFDTGLLLRSEEKGPAYMMLYTDQHYDYTKEVDGQVYSGLQSKLLNYYEYKTERNYYLESSIEVFIREADGKVFRYNTEMEAEELLLDYTLAIGGEFIRPDGQRLLVTKTSEDENGLRTLYLKDLDSGEEDIWQSDCGSLRTGYLLKSDVPGYKVTNLIKKTQFGFFDINEPNLVQFTYHPRILNTYEEQVATEPLTYEFVDDSLHIHGLYALSSISMLYDHIIRLIRNGNDLFIDYVPGYHNPNSGIWGCSYWYYDVKIGGFEPGVYHLYRAYQTIDELVCTGKSAPSDYRPFIEEGKVWKVGEINVANPVYETSCLHYYYFDGDTIIGGVKCKKMMCHDVAKEMYPLSDGTLEATCYVGAMYEQQKKVYIFKPDEKEPLLLYDFGLEPDETEYVAEGGYSSGVCEIKVTSKEYVNNANYKGNYLAWTVFDSYREEWDENALHGWMEGVGYTVEPIYNGVVEVISPRIMTLMSCTVGDEVIYYNPDIIDGVNPPDEETKKRIDFTYIQKPRPKAPHRVAKASGEQVSGEYTMRLLDLGLGTLSENYHVTITDDSDDVVYDKIVRAADVLALNIDISEWTAPSYTITVENDDESYVGTFTPAPLTAVPSVATSKAASPIYYDLSGRRVVGTPKAGLYIVDGKKVLYK